MQPIHIVSIVNENTNFQQVFDGVVALLNAQSNATIQLLYPASVAKKIEAQLSKHKHIGKYAKTNSFNTIQFEEKSNPFTVVKPDSTKKYCIVKPEYFAQLNPLYKSLEKEGVDAETVYVFHQPKQKIPFWGRTWFRLFNTLSAKGFENGCVVFDGKKAGTFFNLKGLNAQNFAYKIASYAALSGIGVQEIDIEFTAHPNKIGAIAAIGNAANNLWQWMVKEPLQVLKTKSEGNVWQAQHPLWRLVFFVVAVLGIIMFPILSFSYGITWDEYGDAEYAKRVLSYYVSFGDDKSVFTEADSNIIFSHLLYYGPMVNLFMAFVAKYISPFGLYETRHIIVALIGIAGIIYAGRLGKLLGNWQTGVFVLLFLIVSPHFFGHSFNNQKDIPFATGYIISIYYLICFLRELPKPSRKTTFLVALSFGLTIGVRIGGLLLPAYLAMGMGLWWLYQTVKTGFKITGKLVLPFAINLIVVGISSYIIGILFWPWALQDPINNPIQSLTKFTNYLSVYNYELFDGKLLFMANKPWYYLPKYIAIQTPLFVFAGIVLFVVFIFSKLKSKNLWLWLLLVFVAVFPVSYAIIKNSSLYNGWRQFLFVYPPLVVLCALGWQWLASVSKQKAVNMAVLGILTGNIAYMAFWMTKNHPNQYVYFNQLVGGMRGAYTYYETDYYSNSLKQAADWFTDNVGTDKPYTISTNNETQTAAYYIKKYNKQANVIWSKEHDVLTKAADYSFITTRGMSHYQLTCGFFPPKGTIHTIDVDGVPLVAIVKRENNYLPTADYYYEKRQFDSAQVYAQKAVDYSPLNVEALRLLGHSYISTENIPKAREVLQKSLALFPDDYLAIELMGEVFFRERQYDSSAVYFKRSTEMRVNFSKGYLNYGVTLFNQKKYEAAIVQFENTIRYADEVEANYYTFIVKCYHALKQYQQGINAAGQALSIDPNHAETYKMLAVIYDEMGNAAQAQEMYRRYIEITGLYE